MENNIEILDDFIDTTVNEEEYSRLLGEYSNDTQSGINEPFFKGAKYSREIVQLFSIVFGFGICLFLADKFPLFEKPIYIIGLVVLVVIEIGKRKSLKEINRIRIINSIYKRRNKLSSSAYKWSFTLFFGLSLLSGFYGSGDIIEYYSEHKPLAMIDSIKSDFNQQIEEVKEEFNLSSSNHFAMAAKLHEESSWRGKTSREVRDEKAKLVVLGATTDSIKMVEVQELKEDLSTALLVAKEDNEEIIKEHKDWANSFAWFAIVFVFILDSLLLGLSHWMANHEARKIKENKVKKELQEQSLKTPKVPVNHTVKPKEVIRLKDGEVREFEDSRGAIIGVPLSTGDIKGYTKGKLKNLFKNSSEERQEALKPYLDKIQNL